MRGRIEQRAGDVADHRIAVAVTRDGGDYVARIELDDADRVVTGASCDELADAVAVIVARLASERRIEPERPAASEPRSAWDARARIAGVSALGIVPGVGVGAELAVVVEHAPWSAELGGLQWASGTRTVDSLQTDHLDVGLRAAVLRIGWRIADLPVRVTASGEIGSMTGGGAEMGSGTWLAVGAGLAGWWQMTSRVRVVGSAEADLARDRVRFELNDGSVLYEPGVGSVRASVGVEVGFR
jgi:hypothetical protein